MPPIGPTTPSSGQPPLEGANIERPHEISKIAGIKDVWNRVCEEYGRLNGKENLPATVEEQKIAIGDYCKASDVFYESVERIVNEYHFELSRKVLLIQQHPDAWQELSSNCAKLGFSLHGSIVDQAKRLSRTAIENPEIAKEIQKVQSKYRLQLTHKDLKPGQRSSLVASLDLAKYSDTYARKLEKKTKDYSTDDMKEDAKALSECFTPSVYVQRNENGISERVAEKKDLGFVDAIIVNGNNDLHQVDHVARLVKDIRKMKKERGLDERVTIVVSGFGGHATSPGKIFAKTEAETMKRRLMDLGVPEEWIIVEDQATNSGENVAFVVAKFEKLEKKPKHILISGTPAAILRQQRSFEKQAKYGWESLVTYPPESLEDSYFTEKHRDALINMMCYLREVGSFLDYSLNSNYMSSRELHDKESLKNPIKIFYKKYEMLTQKKTKISDEELEKISEGFVRFTELKAQGDGETSEAKALQKEINTRLKPAWDYYRRAFMQLEYAWVESLSSDLSQGEQRAILNDYQSATLAALDLEHPFEVV